MKIGSNMSLSPNYSMKSKVNFGVRPNVSNVLKTTTQKNISQATSGKLLQTLKKLQEMVKPMLPSKGSEDAKKLQSKELETTFKENISEKDLNSMKQYFPADEQQDITLKTFMPHVKDDKTLVYNLPDFIKAMDVQESVQQMKTYSNENIPNLKIFNKKVAENMQKNYDKDSLQQMKKLLTDNGVFKIETETKSGLPKTSGVSEEENWEMGARVWITDSMHIANDYMRYNDGKTLKTTLKTFANFYADDKQKKIFDDIHKSSKYKDLAGNEHNEYYEPKNYNEAKHNINGIAHVLIARRGKCEPDKEWFNNKRLESHGLALQTFSKMITTGLRTDNKKDYGYQSAQDVPKEVTKSMAYLVRYFDDIDYPNARTAGNWEEVPFAGGTALDTATIVKALSTFSDLMFNENYNQNEQIQQVRKNINNEMKNIGFQCDQPTIQKMIDNGYKRISQAFQDNKFEEHPSRPYDATSLFITNMNGIKLAETPLEDIQKKMLILSQLENNLVGDYGVMRYKDDSYLNTNYNIAQTPKAEISFTWKEKLSEFGSKDASTKEAQAEREQLVKNSNHEAQWAFQSQMSVGYVKLLNELNSAVKDGSVSLNDETINLAKNLKEMADLNLNRSLARITDEDPSASHQIKANGEASPAWAVPEAYQAVTSINPESKEVETKYTVGINTPLSWGQCGLYKAFYSYEKVLEHLTPELSEKIGL